MQVYITREGQAWDQIAKEVWGKEHLLHFLMDANPEYLHYSLLPGGLKLRVPDLPPQDKEVEAPPWR